VFLELVIPDSNEEQIGTDHVDLTQLEAQVERGQFKPLEVIDPPNGHGKNRGGESQQSDTLPQWQTAVGAGRCGAFTHEGRMTEFGLGIQKESGEGKGDG
jgi:hypothetical protein